MMSPPLDVLGDGKVRKEAHSGAASDEFARTYARMGFYRCAHTYIDVLSTADVHQCQVFRMRKLRDADPR